MNVQDVSNFFSSYKVIVLIASLWIIDWCIDDYEQRNKEYIKQFYDKHKRKNKG